MHSDVEHLVAELRAGRQTLHDVDKAELVVKIVAAGMSRRELAKATGHSEGLIRRLELIAEALPEEKELARDGKLSTNQLVALIASRKRDQAAALAEKQKAEKADAARRGAKHIIEWLAGKVGEAYAEQALDEVRFRFAYAKLPHDSAPRGTGLDEIIAKCGAALPERDDEIFLERIIKWLVLWVFYAFPDPDVRDDAVRVALAHFARG